MSKSKLKWILWQGSIKSKIKVLSIRVSNGGSGKEFSLKVIQGTERHCQLRQAKVVGLGSPSPCWLTGSVFSPRGHLDSFSFAIFQSVIYQLPLRLLVSDLFFLARENWIFWHFFKVTVSWDIIHTSYNWHI